MKMSIKVERRGDVLRIELPLEEPRLSKSGKNRLIASTYGVKRTEVRYRGHHIVVVANAFIRPSTKPKEVPKEGEGPSD